MQSPSLGRPGAVAADPPDDDAAAHYGDPFAEQRALAGDGGWVDRGARGVLRITGPDRRTWLHSLTTQHFESLPPGAGTEALVLSPHGHVEHHLVVAETDDVMWVDVEPGTATALRDFLDSMRFMMRVDVTDVTGTHRVVSLAGARTGAVLESLGVSLDPAAYAVATGEGVVARRMPWPGEHAVDLVLADEAMPSVLEAFDAGGLHPAGIWAFDALRVAAHRPRFGVDTDHRTLPHEVGWIETAVHLAKGCYRGQETVARVHNLGRPPRRLVLLHLDGSEERLPSTGDAVVHEAADVGVVGTVARHYELGPIALALVRRGLPLDAVLSAGGVPASAEVIVDPEAGLHIKPALR